MAWRLLDFQNKNIFENMAIDEAVFTETVSNKKEPTLRFYTSSPAAVTIGYFQDATKELPVEKCRGEGIDIARRITGGRAVFHFQEITYSLTAGAAETLFPADILGTYKIISRCIARGLGYLGINAVLEEEGRVQRGRGISPCCFSAASKNELLVNGRKICGSAQARKKGGFLQHGILALNFNADKTADVLLGGKDPRSVEKLKKSVTAISAETSFPVDVREACSCLARGFSDELGIDWEVGTLTPSEEKLKDTLVKKYTDSNWTLDRKNI